VAVFTAALDLAKLKITKIVVTREGFSSVMVRPVNFDIILYVF